MTRLNDTIITRFPFSLEGRRAPRDRRGRWEDVCEMKSLLCWNKSGRRRALNHSDTNNKTTHIQEKTSRWSHQTGSGEGAGGFEQTVRVQLLFNATQTFNVLQQLHCLLVLKRRGTFSVEHTVQWWPNLYDASPKIYLRHLGRVKCYTAVTFTKIPAADRRGNFLIIIILVSFAFSWKPSTLGALAVLQGAVLGWRLNRRRWRHFHVVGSSINKTNIPTTAGRKKRKHVFRNSLNKLKPAASDPMVLISGANTLSQCCILSFLHYHTCLFYNPI